jgi:hypothetical protein
LIPCISSCFLRARALHSRQKASDVFYLLDMQKTW